MGAFQLCAFAFAITALPVLTFAQRANSGHNQSEKFPTLRTFSFKQTTPGDAISVQTTLYDDPFTRECTKAAIANQLQARRLTRNDAHPDVYVATQWTFRTEYLIYGPYAWWGWPGENRSPYAYSYGAPWYTDPVAVGTLTIDVSNANGELLWRGIGQMTVHLHENPAGRRQDVGRAVTKVFQEFPPTGAVGTSGGGVPTPPRRNPR